MGQTLPNGIYLPAEGERNCYDGLEGNWRSLDSLISTVAGKASATHTHGNITNDGKVGTTANLPLITGTGGAVQAGSFGNQANTFCEGNDSRLSDARTPVAHTHGKADVTDLFNSANVWTEENTFTANNINFKRSFTLGDSSYNICRLQYQDASLTRWGTLNFIHSTDNSVNCDIGVVAKKENDTVNVNASIRLTIKPDNSAELIPLNNNKINLGSSTYKWKTLNGINPGALSLPNPSAAIELDATGWDLTGATSISYTSTFDGWLELRCADVAGDYLFATCGEYRLSVRGNGAISAASAGLALTIPVRANISISIIVKASSRFRVFLIPCLGNV